MSVLLGSHICLHVCCSSLDIWCSKRARGSVDDLISDPESPQIIVPLEDIHDFSESEELLFRPCWVCLHDRGIEGIQIKPDVDSCVGESFHASIVVGIRVDMVYTDRVRSNFFHGLGIELTLDGVDERISWSALIRNTWVQSAWIAAGGGPRCLPLRKNCSPSAKNFAPLTEMVGMARAVRAKHAANTAPKIEVNMLQLMFARLDIVIKGKDEVATGSKRTNSQQKCRAMGGKQAREIKMQ